MNTDLLITVSGHPASGTTTLVETLAEVFELEVLSGGDIFRNMARERGIKPFELSELAETDDSIDAEVDERLKDAIQNAATSNTGLIVDSRLAGWHADRRADLAVWLEAPRDVRFNRLDNRTETQKELKRREESDSMRYKELYGIDIDDMAPYDIVVDTETFTAEQVKTIVVTTLLSLSRTDSEVRPMNDVETLVP
jgi:cytidylate kinase